MLTMKRLLAFLIATVAATASAQNTFPASGNVGIGTPAPSYALDIQRLGYAEMRLFGNNNGAQVDTRYQALNVDGSTNNIVTGVGINANNQYLIIDQLRNNDIYQYLSPATGTNEAHAWYIGGNEKMRINYLGNVGIGTNTPGAKLEVNGALKT